MPRTVNQVMTHDPRTVTSEQTLLDAARVMADEDIGDVIVTDNGKLSGIVTDRDIVIRAVAQRRDPTSTPVSEICTSGVVTLTPDQTIEDAVRIVRDQAVRRIPVVQDGRPVGIVALGDLAVDRDPDSTLAAVSAEDPNN